ncbi:MAG: hypothetical protein ACKOBZ_09000 [Nitrospira sp.]|nr:hypothetical protein [Nitrospira sp.]
MIRLLLVGGLLVLSYFLLRSAIKEFRGLKTRGGALAGKDDMVLCPMCKTYVPRGSAVPPIVGGQPYLFCSSTCAEAFQKQSGG